MIASGSVTTLVSRTTFPSSSIMQIAVSLTDTSRPTECFMAVLPLRFVAGLPGARFQRQGEELPLPSPADTISADASQARRRHKSCCCRHHASYAGIVQRFPRGKIRSEEHTSELQSRFGI